MRVESTGLMAYIAHAATLKAETSEHGIFARIQQAVWRSFVSIADWFLSWSEGYRALKESFCAKVETPKPQRNWIKIGLVAAGILAVGIGLYYYSSFNVPTKLTTFEKIEIAESLESTCREAVESYCKEGEYLRDYLDPNWEPIVLPEYDRDILCSVHLRASNCSELVGQPTVQQWREGKLPFVFMRNYESIPFNMPTDLSEKAQSFLEKFPTTFKSHIFCFDK